MYHWEPIKICHCKLKFSKNLHQLGKDLWDCILGLMCLPSSPVQAWLCVWLLFLSIFLQVLMKQSCWNQGNHREENLLRGVLCESYFFFWKYILAKMYAFRRLRFYCQCFTSFFHSKYMNVFSLSHYQISFISWHTLRQSLPLFYPATFDCSQPGGSLTDLITYKFSLLYSFCWTHSPNNNSFPSKSNKWGYLRV